MAVILKCPHCETKFRVEFGTADGGGWPDYCPNKKCGIFMGVDRADDDVVMPAFLSARSKANDQLYRDMERGSEFRAEKAAEMAGVDVSEMSSLKITNLNDRRDSEIAAIEVNNPVTQAMAQAPGITGFQANGAAFAQATNSGPYARAGASVVTRLSQTHHERVQVLAQSGKRR